MEDQKYSEDELKKHELDNWVSSLYKWSHDLFSFSAHSLKTD